MTVRWVNLLVIRKPKRVWRETTCPEPIRTAVDWASSTRSNYMFSLVIGGSLGNLFDRIYYYAVPDFIDLHLGNYHWFIFNVADIFITVGIIGLILVELLKKGKISENA